MGACYKGVHSGVGDPLWTSVRPEQGCCSHGRLDFRHIEGFLLPIRWIMRAVGLLQPGCHWIGEYWRLPAPRDKAS